LPFAVALGLVFAVIVALPDPTAVIVPVALFVPLPETDATPEALLLHTTVLSVAFVGATVAVTVVLLPTLNVPDVGLTLIPVAHTVGVPRHSFELALAAAVKKHAVIIANIGFIVFSPFCFIRLRPKDFAATSKKPPRIGGQGVE